MISSENAGKFSGAVCKKDVSVVISSSASCAGVRCIRDVVVLEVN